MQDVRGVRGGDRTRAGRAAHRFLSQARSQRAAGRLEEARLTLHRALGARPGDPEAHYELGAMASAANAPGQAIPHFVAALRADPDRPAYWLALATALLAEGRLPDARALIDQFLARAFEGADTKSVLAAFVEQTFEAAKLHYAGGDLHRAEALLDLVIRIDDTHPRATYLAGIIAAHTNRPELAFDLLSIAIYREPGNAAFFSGLGAVLTMFGDHDGAVSALDKAVELDPGLAVAHINLAGVHQKCFRHGTALRCADAAIALDPRLAGAHCNRGSSLLAMGRLREAIEAFDRAIELEPTKLSTYSNRLFAKLYAAHLPPEAYFADAVAFGRRFAEPLRRTRPFANERSPDRVLRVGFVSGDLCSHALTRFLEPFLRAFDRAAFACHAYMTHAGEDATSERIRPLFQVWRNVAGLNDAEALARIEADGIDILVDLSGHSAGHRLTLFARRPAPVQLTWIGHPGSTGLTAIDYRLTDPVTDPVGLAEPLHTERLWRLPRVTATYLAPEDRPPARLRAPFEENGHLTFGCFNRLTKVSDGTLATWARILEAVPDARLFMVVADIGSPEVRAEVEARLSGLGLPLDRVDFHPRINAAYFGLYHRVDVALDPYPYNGGTTSYDTLSMGVPFITLRGGHAAARTGVSVLTAVGLEALVAADADAYVAIAQGLDRDRDGLRRLREGLRARFEACPLMDHAGLAAEVGTAFRAMWRRWLAEGDAGMPVAQEPPTAATPVPGRDAFDAHGVADPARAELP